MLTISFQENQDLCEVNYEYFNTNLVTSVGEYYSYDLFKFFKGQNLKFMTPSEYSNLIQVKQSVQQVDNKTFDVIEQLGQIEIINGGQYYRLDNLVFTNLLYRRNDDKSEGILIGYGFRDAAPVFDQYQKIDSQTLQQEDVKCFDLTMFNENITIVDCIATNKQTGKMQNFIYSFNKVGQITKSFKFDNYPYGDINILDKRLEYIQNKKDATNNNYYLISIAQNNTINSTALIETQIQIYNLTLSNSEVQDIKFCLNVNSTNLNYNSTLYVSDLQISRNQILILDINSKVIRFGIQEGRIANLVTLLNLFYPSSSFALGIIHYQNDFSIFIQQRTKIRQYFFKMEVWQPQINIDYNSTFDDEEWPIRISPSNNFLMVNKQNYVIIFQRNIQYQHLISQSNSAPKIMYDFILNIQYSFLTYSNNLLVIYNNKSVNYLLNNASMIIKPQLIQQDIQNFQITAIGFDFDSHTQMTCQIMLNLIFVQNMKNTTIIPSGKQQITILNPYFSDNQWKIDYSPIYDQIGPDVHYNIGYNSYKIKNTKLQSLNKINSIHQFDPNKNIFLTVAKTFYSSEEEKKLFEQDDNSNRYVLYINQDSYFSYCIYNIQNFLYECQLINKTINGTILTCSINYLGLSQCLIMNDAGKTGIYVQSYSTFQWVQAVSFQQDTILYIINTKSAYEFKYDLYIAILQNRTSGEKYVQVHRTNQLITAQIVNQWQNFSEYNFTPRTIQSNNQGQIMIENRDTILFVCFYDDEAKFLSLIPKRYTNSTKLFLYNVSLIVVYNLTSYVRIEEYNIQNIYEPLLIKDIQTYEFNMSFNGKIYVDYSFSMNHLYMLAKYKNNSLYLLIYKTNSPNTQALYKAYNISDMTLQSLSDNDDDNITLSCSKLSEIQNNEFDLVYIYFKNTSYVYKVLRAQEFKIELIQPKFLDDSQDYSLNISGQLYTSSFMGQTPYYSKIEMQLFNNLTNVIMDPDQITNSGLNPITNFDDKTLQYSYPSEHWYYGQYLFLKIEYPTKSDYNIMISNRVQQKPLWQKQDYIISSFFDPKTKFLYSLTKFEQSTDIVIFNPEFVPVTKPIPVSYDTCFKIVPAFDENQNLTHGYLLCSGISIVIIDFKNSGLSYPFFLDYLNLKYQNDIGYTEYKDDILFVQKRVSSIFILSQIQGSVNGYQIISQNNTGTAIQVCSFNETTLEIEDLSINHFSIQNVNTTFRKFFICYQYQNIIVLDINIQKKYYQIEKIDYIYINQLINLNTDNVYINYQTVILELKFINSSKNITFKNYTGLILTTNTQIYQVKLSFQYNPSSYYYDFNSIEFLETYNNYGDNAQPITYILQQEWLKGKYIQNSGITLGSKYFSIVYKDIQLNKEEKHYQYALFYRYDNLSGDKFKNCHGGYEIEFDTIYDIYQIQTFIQNDQSEDQVISDGLQYFQQNGLTSFSSNISISFQPSDSKRNFSSDIQISPYSPYISKDDYQYLITNTKTVYQYIPKPVDPGQVQLIKAWQIILISVLALLLCAALYFILRKKKIQEDKKVKELLVKKYEKDEVHIKIGKLNQDSQMSDNLESTYE